MNAQRALDNERQVALLFLILFGVLGAASIAAFVRSLRPQDSAELERHERLLPFCGATSPT